jgi:hypothetical protein
MKGTNVKSTNKGSQRRGKVLPLEIPKQNAFETKETTENVPEESFGSKKLRILCDKIQQHKRDVLRNNPPLETSYDLVLNESLHVLEKDFVISPKNAENGTFFSFLFLDFS